MRATYDHQGLDDKRANSHDNRLLYPGMRDRNKRAVQMFPFNFRPTQGVCGGACAPSAPPTPHASKFAHAHTPPSPSAHGSEDFGADARCAREFDLWQRSLISTKSTTLRWTSEDGKTSDGIRDTRARGALCGARCGVTPCGAHERRPFAVWQRSLTSTKSTTLRGTSEDGKSSDGIRDACACRGIWSEVWCDAVWRARKTPVCRGAGTYFVNV